MPRSKTLAMLMLRSSNRPNVDKATPLHRASQYGHTDRNAKRQKGGDDDDNGGHRYDGTQEGYNGDNEYRIISTTDLDGNVRHVLPGSVVTDELNGKILLEFEKWQRKKNEERNRTEIVEIYVEHTFDWGYTEFIKCKLWVGDTYIGNHEDLFYAVRYESQTDLGLQKGFYIYGVNGCFKKIFPQITAPAPAEANLNQPEKLLNNYMHILRALEPILFKLRDCCVGWHPDDVFLTVEFPRATLSYGSAGGSPRLVVIYRDVGRGIIGRKKEESISNLDPNFMYKLESRLTGLAMEDKQTVLIMCTHRKVTGLVYSARAPPQTYTQPTEDIEHNLQNLWIELKRYNLGDWGEKLIPNAKGVGVGGMSARSAGFMVAEIEYKYSTDTSKVLALDRQGFPHELVNVMASYFDPGIA